LPLHLLLPKVDDVYQMVCLHCHYPDLWQQQILLSIQVAFSILFMLGILPTLTAFVSWYLYLSLTLRNTWMNYILDRYFHYLLLHAIFLPTAKKFALWSGGTRGAQSKTSPSQTSSFVISPATISLKLLLLWIYMDAGGGKYMDPLGGWSYTADPLPALDTYTRHTTAARYVYALLGPTGLRVMTPTVVWVELLAVPTAMVGSFMGSRILTYLSIALICSLHLGIAICLNNSALLSLAACVPWAVFLPIGWKSVQQQQQPSISPTRIGWKLDFNLPNLTAALCLTAMMLGSVWIDALSASCDQSVRHIWSTLLHNRWNVFVGAEEYVTWEIAPGQLADGSIVDIWGRTSDVNWAMPGSGAPCTSTARPGRWRSFPYLAELEGAEGEALWGYLCDEWDREQQADLYPERKLVKYNFFMLQADVLPNMAFSATRKRLIHAHECIKVNTSMENPTINATRNDQEIEETEEVDNDSSRSEL